MSKNIIIQEGGTSYQFTAKKLKTDHVDGGTCLWVPEEEVSLGTKYISANGTYKASDDGKYGFSQVIVNVAGGKGSADDSGKPISSGGDPDIGSSFIGIDPTDGEPYEYTVNPQGEVEKTPVSTATPSDIGSSFIGIDPTDGEPYEYTVNPQGEVEKTPVSTVTPGGPGSGVVGTDPEDGNEYFIGIDEGGNIVKTKIPSGIEIGKSPDKTSYIAGETIDYSGIIVTLKGGDSAMFSNSDYPNGRIPFNELIFPMSVAPDVPSFIIYTTPADNTSAVYRAQGKTFSFVEVDLGTEFYGNMKSRIFTIINASGKIFATNRHGWYTTSNGNRAYDYDHIILASNAPFKLHYKSGNSESDRTVNLHGGIYEYTIQTYIGSNSSIPMQDQLISDSGISTDMIQFGLGQGEGDVDVPVKWKSRYDGRTFEDTFEIAVTSSGSVSGSTDGGGYSDDSGGSSSGGGTSF